MAKAIVIDTSLDLNNLKFKNAYVSGVGFRLCGDIVAMSNAF